MAASDDKLNRAARFLPMEAEDELSLPCIEVAGVLVFLYVKDGVVRVSVDLDTAELADSKGLVPLEVTVQGTTVFEG